MRIDIYYHCIKNATHFHGFMGRLMASGLYDVADAIYVCCDFEFSYESEKVFISNYKDPFADEMTTLRLMRNNAEDRDGYVLFYRDIGDGKVWDDETILWNEYLSYFLLDGHRSCINDLSVFKAVSVDFDINDAGYCYFNGNCWWSRYSHIKTLDMDIGRPRLWLMSKPYEPVACLHHSGIVESGSRYEPSLYVKGIKAFS